MRYSSRMEPLTPDQATLVVNTLYLPQVTTEHGITKSILAAIPDDKASYRPDPVVKTAFELAWHIVSAEIRFLQAASSGQFDYGNSSAVEGVQTPAQIADWYEMQFGPAADRLRKSTGQELVRRVDFRGLFQLPAYAYVSFAMSHTIHHRGQLSTYLRPMGAKVPSIYGESYDARQAREAGQGKR
jgi:uncharacterized damage-inducible protein DinB